MPNQPTIILFIVSLSVLSIFIFPNTIYYRLNLLVIVFLTLAFLFYTGCITSLTVLMLVIVYVGAIIILIGYVCAVCPNVNMSSQTAYVPFVSLLFVISTLFFPSNQSFLPAASISIFDFFYSSYGVSVFLLLIFMLFVILLVVTSYYVSPKGPFRSVS